MEIKKQLYNDLHIISRIILLANSSFDVVKYLEADNPEDSSVLRWEKNFSYFFPFVNVNFYRITIIELSKLFNHTEHYSLKKLLLKFNDNQIYEGLIYKETLKLCNREIKSKSILIKELIELRNKHYAHQDEDFTNYITLEIDKIDQLLTLCKHVFNLIYQELNEKSYYFDFPLGKPLDSLDQIMNKIQFYNDFYKNLEDKL